MQAPSIKVSASKSNQNSVVHKSVLLQQSILGLDIKAGDVFVDATLGGGGHSEAVCEVAHGNVTIIGVDADQKAVQRSQMRLKKQDCKILFKQSNFRNLDVVLAELGFTQVDKILFDLGLSSQEIQESGRGFTFQKNEPLLMTFNAEPKEEDLTAREIVNTWDEENIETIIKSYGEEKYARRIARMIVESRAEKPIETTFDLVEIIKMATPSSYHRMKIHPATRTFQALRMTVNDEVRTLTEGLEKSFASLRVGGRIAVISFHSIEDRVVKHYFKKLAVDGKLILINKKPITPTDEEIAENPRSRSAKLRIIEKI
ncbi:16S rRNA (cytosine(1402)-N(4))-methyltransferase RsmH [Candidatus Parcubacteria bacterium]|nr:16S rRNA (cytosine(1402)-N(4))-methyltransferase RsmH [Candidatus Parcubacteria bacterium]